MRAWDRRRWYTRVRCVVFQEYVRAPTTVLSTGYCGTDGKCYLVQSAVHLYIFQWQNNTFTAPTAVDSITEIYSGWVTDFVQNPLMYV